MTKEEYLQDKIRALNAIIKGQSQTLGEWMVATGCSDPKAVEIEFDRLRTIEMDNQ